MKFPGIFVLLLFIFTLQAPAQAIDYNVSNVSELINAVNSANDNDTIIVAAGNYELTQTLTISKDITLKSSGAVTLDGQNNRRVIKITGGSPTIEGFTIKNGKAGDDELTGGGIKIEGGSLITVTNCRFENNEATTNGGGIYVFQPESAVIKNCTFINNKANSSGYEGGGGIFVYDDAIVTITNCTFTGNTSPNTNSGNSSGALCVAIVSGSGGANVTVNYCTFATASDKILMNKTNTFAVKNSIIREIVAGNDANLNNVTQSNNITIATVLTAEDVPDSTGKVTHTVFRKHSELSSLAGDKGNDTTVTTDQLGNNVSGNHDIGAVEIAAHVHDFTYSASGATLTATCREAGLCDLTDKKATLTIIVPKSLAYDGTAKTATVSGEIPGVTTPAIVYKQGTTELKSAPVNAGEYTANITLTNVVQTDSLSTGSVTASVSFTITKKPATVTAKAQTVKEGGSIVQGTGQVTTSGLLSGHTLSAVTLTASSTASATTSGTITPSGAKITDGKNDVTANYAIEYKTGTLTVESGSSGGGDSGGGSGGGETTPIDPNDPNITGVKLSITTDTPEITLTPGETKKLNFTATVTITYNDGSTKTEPARIQNWWRGDGAWPDWMKIHSSFNANPNTVDLTPGADVGGTTMTLSIAAETESYDGHTDLTECEFKVTVQAPETFTPKNLFFEKPIIKMTVEPGNTVEDSVNVMLQLYGSRGTVKESTDGYTLVCEKESVRAGWVTSSVDGWKITFRAAPPENQTESYTTLFTIYVVDNKDGKGYLKTSYRVVTSISKLTGYQLTVAPAEVTVLAGAESKVDLKNNVRFEKVYENGRRTAVDDAKLTFSPSTSGRATPWMNLDSGGVVTLNLGADVKVGRYFCDYRAVADDNGQTETAEGTLIVNVVRDGAPAITTETLPDAEIDKAYSALITATGVEPYWTISGTLPEGLTFDSKTGKLSGTPTRVGDYTFDVEAMNSAGSDHRVFNLKVRNQKPSSWHWARSSKATMSGSTGTWHATFNVKKGTNVSYYDKSTTKDNLDKAHLKKVIKTKGVKAGEGYIKFNLLWPKTNNKWEEYTYAFKVQAKNNEGISTYEKSFTVAENTGKLSVAGVSLAADDAITEDNGVETFEPYRDGETPEDDGLAEGVTYLVNGSIDEDGNITAVIGAAAETDSEGNALNKEYVYATVGEMLSALADRLDKVVGLEFRSGSVFDAESVKKLPNLSDLSVDECDVTDFDLSGNTVLTSLSLYACKNLTALDVSGCSALVTLSVTECPVLADLNVTGCGVLESVEVTDAAITALDLSNRPELANLDMNGCASLASLNVTGCAGLTDVSLNGTAITELDLNAASGLTSLSLAECPALWELTLPSGAKFDNFTLTGSRVMNLTLNGSEKLTFLNLSGNAAMLELDLSGVPALTELDVSGCGFSVLDLSGLTMLEKLNANDCAAMITLNLEGCDKLSELNVGGCSELRSLDVSGRALGYLNLDGLKWLTEVDCSGQIIGNAVMGLSINLSDYAGNSLYRVTDVLGYGADGGKIETVFDKETGVVTFASVPKSVEYLYNTGLYDNVMDVLLGADESGNISGKGGCNAGFSALSALGYSLLQVMALILAWTSRKRD